MDIQDTVILFIELMGTVAFSASGAIVGIGRRMDIFGVCVMGISTAVGGGMIRDIMLSKVPSSLLHPIYIIVAAITAIVMFILAYFRAGTYKGKVRVIYEKVMLWADSLGLGIFTAIGVLTGIRAGYIDHTLLLVFLGTLTGVGGGLLRDTMAGVRPYIFIKHIYALASIFGSLIYIPLYRFFGEITATTVTSLFVLVVRLLSAHFRWNLPKLHIDEYED